MGVLKLKVGGSYIDVVQGPAGPIGPQGPEGDQGPQGPQGPPAPAPGAWTALAAGANITASDGATYYAPQCRLNNDKVELRGQFATTTTISDAAVVFTLPVGFRPARTVGLTVNIKSSSGGAITNRLTVNTDGTVQKWGTFASGYELFLDGLWFSLSV